MPARGQATGPKAQSQPQPDCPQGAETTGRGNPSSRPSPKSLVAASAQSKRALLPARPASPEAHTRPISQPEFPLDEPSGATSRPGSGRDGVRSRGELGGFRPDLVPRPWTCCEEEPAGQAAPRRAPGAELRFTCPPWQRRGGAGRRAADPAGSPTPRSGPRGRTGIEEHPEAPIPSQGEGDVARCPGVPRALLRELRGGGSQGRVLLAAAPGTSRPPRRCSHWDRKPSRRPERPVLAPRAVPDGSWPPVLLDSFWFQAIVRIPEWTHFRHGPARRPPQLPPPTRLHLPPLWAPQLGQEGRRAATRVRQEHLLPSPAAGREVPGEAVYCCVQRSRNRKWGSPEHWSLPPHFLPILGGQPQSQKGH